MTNTLSVCFATLGSAGMAFLGNRWLFRRFGGAGVRMAVPWWEEACKAAAIGILPGLPIFAVHALFGVVELAYDLFGSEAQGKWLGVLALAGHISIGSAAVLVETYGGGIRVIFLAAVATHTVFQWTVSWVSREYSQAGVGRRVHSR